MRDAVIEKPAFPGSSNGKQVIWVMVLQGIGSVTTQRQLEVRHNNATVLPLEDEIAEFEQRLPPERENAEIEQSLDKLLPRALVRALPAETPENLLSRLRVVPSSERPGVICLDARSSSPGDVVAWLKRFDLVVHESVDDRVAPWGPRRVVFLLAPAHRATDYAHLQTRPDIDLISTKDESSGVEELYRRHLRTGIRSFLRPGLKGRFSSEAEANSEPAMRFIPPDERGAWHTRLDELERHGGE